MRSICLVAVCALVACNSAKPWKTKTKSDLKVESSSGHSMYQEFAELDDVQPKLVVTGEGPLKTAVQTKLIAAGAGTDGTVKVELQMPASVSGDGTLQVKVTYAGSWGSGPKHHTVTGSIGGTIAYESSGGASAELTKEIGDKIADEILKSFAAEKPKHAGPPKPPAAAVAVGRGMHMTCSLHKDGTVRCWNGARGSRLGPVPFPIANVAGAVEIAIGDDLGCARLEDGGVRCWDSTRWKDDEAVFGATPVCGVDHAVALSRGAPTCALEQDGRVVCWGSSGFDAGCGQTDAAVVPKLVATQVATSFENACAIGRNGEVSCWHPCREKCRDEKFVRVNHPKVAGATTIAVGGTLCAILKNDVVRCVFPDGKPAEAVDVTVPGAIRIASEYQKRSAITKDHQLYTWPLKGTPALAQGANKAIDVSASSDATCIVNEAGEVWCAERDGPLARVVYAKG